MTTDLAVVASGPPRSATTYIAHLLTAAGLPCGHEHAYRLPGPDWDRPHLLADDRPAESSWIAAPWLGHLDATTVALLRAPLAVIRSQLGTGWLNVTSVWQYQFAAHHVPEIVDHPPGSRRLAAFWLGWTQLAVDAADHVWHVADVTADQLATVAGCTPARAGVALGTIRRDLNTRPNSRPVDVDDLKQAGLYDRLRDAAARHGLPMDYWRTT